MGGLALHAAVDAVPVLAGRDRHAADREILVELVEGRGTSASSRDNNARADLHGLVEARAVEEPVQARDQRRVRGRVITGRRHDKAVRLFELRRDLIDDIVEYALAVLRAAVAGDASADGLVAYPDDFRLYPFCLKDLHHLIQRNAGVAALAGASVKNQNLHYLYSFIFLDFLHRRDRLMITAS